eukprot:2008918-Amphidinium_carterae.1
MEICFKTFLPTTCANLEDGQNLSPSLVEIVQVVNHLWEILLLTTVLLLPHEKHQKAQLQGSRGRGTPHCVRDVSRLAFSVSCSLSYRIARVKTFLPLQSYQKLLQ